MIPGAYVFLAEFPLTKNGKIDKKALPQPEEGHYVQRKFISPQTLEEKTLSSIWSKLLGIHSISVQDHFFELGGNSFSALKLLSVTEAEFKTPIALSDFLPNPTIAQLAQLVSRSREENRLF